MIHWPMHPRPAEKIVPLASQPDYPKPHVVLSHLLTWIGASIIGWGILGVVVLVCLAVFR